MAKSINFKTLKKQFLTITLPNGKVLQIGTPTKKVYDALSSIQTNIDDGSDGNIDELYEATAVAMSRNKTGAKITKEYLEDLLDIEDVIVFYNAYLGFINELSNVKN